MREYIEFIPKAGVCLTTKNVMERRGRIRWMKRDPSTRPADNGWRIFSHIDTTQYLKDPINWHIADFNDVCYIEPALIGIYDFPIGSDLELVYDVQGIHIVDVLTGREISHELFYVPPRFRA